VLNEKTMGEGRVLNEYVEEREADVACKKWIKWVLKIVTIVDVKGNFLI
jgi:hypothetical protein